MFFFKNLNFEIFQCCGSPDQSDARQPPIRSVQTATDCHGTQSASRGVSSQTSPASSEIPPPTSGIATVMFIILDSKGASLCLSCVYGEGGRVRAKKFLKLLSSYINKCIKCNGESDN